VCCRRDAALVAGTIGQFNFQALLVSLTSSLALLAVAKTVVDFLAFQILPLKYIYKQYRMIDTVDFSDLTDGDAAVFKKHDLINPHPKVGLRKLKEPLLGTQREVSESNIMLSQSSGAEATELGTRVSHESCARVCVCSAQ
jgi:hypothetical protein